MTLRAKDHLLLAMDHLSRAIPGGVVDLTSLILEAWRRSPTHFGLRGVRGQHPCSNSVKAAIYVYGGPLRQGLISKAGDAVMERPGVKRGVAFTLTTKGREAAEGLKVEARSVG